MAKIYCNKVKKWDSAGREEQEVIQNGVRGHPVCDRFLTDADRGKIILFDKHNPPKWWRQGEELSSEETLEKLVKAAKNESQYVSLSKRTEPHCRSVLIKAPDDLRNPSDIFKASKAELQQEGEKEPKIALLDRENYVRGSAPVHSYLENMGIDRIVELIDTGRLSITYSGLPEACYYRLEDGMDKGRDAYAGTISGEAEYTMNKDMSMTIAHFVNSDNVHVIEESKAAEIDAAEKEWAEEKNDWAVDGHLPYEEFTGDYRGWDDPDYEPDDDMERCDQFF